MNEDNSSEKSIYQYLDFRLYLHDVFERKKKSKVGFSFRQFSKLAKFSSGHYVKYVIDGKRNLGEDGFEKIVGALKLSKKEISFLFPPRPLPLFPFLPFVLPATAAAKTSLQIVGELPAVIQTDIDELPTSSAANSKVTSQVVFGHSMAPLQELEMTLIGPAEESVFSSSILRNKTPQ